MQQCSQTTFFFLYVLISISTVLLPSCAELISLVQIFDVLSFMDVFACFPPLSCLEFLSYKHYLIFYLCARFHISISSASLDLYTMHCQVRYPRFCNFATLQSTKNHLKISTYLFKLLYYHTKFNGPTSCDDSPQNFAFVAEGIGKCGFGVTCSGTELERSIVKIKTFFQISKRKTTDMYKYHDDLKDLLFLF